MEHSPFPFLNICFMFEVFLSSVCTCFLFLSSNLLSWEERESLPRVAALLGEAGPFLIRLKGEGRSLFRGAGRDCRVVSRRRGELKLATWVLPPSPRLLTRESKLWASCLVLCSLQHLEQRPDHAGLPKNPQPDWGRVDSESRFHEGD